MPHAQQAQKTFRIGLLKATLWKNATDNRSYYSVDIVRSYRDKNGEWQEVF